MRQNKLKKTFKEGKAVINGWLQIPSSFSAEVMANQGWDSLTVDMQHGVIDYPNALQMLQAISTTETVPLARVNWNDPGQIMKILDAGCYGVICPMISNRKEAEKFIQACMYPPKGYRSFGPIRGLIYGGGDYGEHANDEILKIAMIETKESLDKLDEIMSTPGLNGIYIGPADLSLAIGQKPAFDNAEGTPTYNEIVNILNHAKKNNISVPKDKKGEAPFSVDDNLFHTSTEGKVLENPKNQASEFIFQRTTSPEKAPNKASYVTISFKNGDPITVNGKKLSPGNLLQKLNILAGKNGIGRVDLVENRFIGIKSRGVYETPGGTLLMVAHRAIESVTLDKETMHKKDEIMSKYAELIYNGYWYSKARFKLQKIMDLKRNKVNGSVKLKLYKGNITIVSRQTKSKAYSIKKVSFEENKTFDKSNVERFINLHKKKLRQN